MKKGLFLLTLLFIGGAILLNTGCEEDPKEACEQDMFCDGEVAVTACCTDGEDCYFTYNGKNYPDTAEGIEDLIADLNCTTTKAAAEEDEHTFIYAQLESLVKIARLKSSN